MTLNLDEVLMKQGLEEILREEMESCENNVGELKNNLELEKMDEVGETILFFRRQIENWWNGSSWSATLQGRKKCLKIWERKR